MKIFSKELRRKYIDFFIKKGHAEIPSASLIPENDPSTLFISAGMQPLVPFLLGEKHPAGERLVNSQKCIRTGDIDDVGDKVHHTFFEMLGHWSLGDYFKDEAIKMSWEFLTDELNIKPERLAFSIFAGDETAPKDEQAAEIWQSLGVKLERIAYLSKKDNWWEPAGSSGPAGPDTEMFYWTDDKEKAPDNFDPKDSRWVEIGNDVLMQYEKQGKGKYKPAKQKNIDNGTGLERLLAVMNGFDDNYQTDLFKPIIEKIEKLSGKKYNQTEEISRSIRVIADHLRAVTFIMADRAGIEPSNIDQGYVVRKLIRRAIRHGRMIGIQENFTHQIVEVVIKMMSDIYEELEKNKEFVISNLKTEEEKFSNTLQQGLKQFDIEVQKLQGKALTGEIAFNLYQTYGFPSEMTKELANEKAVKITADFDQVFNNKMISHQDLSRTAAAGKFKGGLAEHSEKAIKYHTANHLLLAGLRQVLGSHVNQRGSNITDERLRFDFSHSEKMTEEDLKQVEDLVNKWIKQNLEVKCEELTLDQAKARGATGVFEHKYGDKVKVFTIGNKDIMVSQEICGGPHVKRTGELGEFKIKKEQSSSAGIRRIKAILK